MGDGPQGDADAVFRDPHQRHAGQSAVVAAATVSGSLRERRVDMRHRDQCWPEHCRAFERSSRYRSVVALCADRVSNIRPQCRRSATHRTGDRVEDAGAEGDSRKQREEEQKQNNKNISSGETPLRARHDELVERTSVPRVFSRSSWTGRFLPRAAASSAAAQPPRRPSLARMLYVRQAAPVSITSQPMPRDMIAPSRRGSGNRCRGPEPSTTISGFSANTASRSAARQLVDGLRTPVVDQPIRADQAASLQHRVADAHLARRVRAHQQRAANSVVGQFH